MKAMKIMKKIKISKPFELHVFHTTICHFLVFFLAPLREIGFCFLGCGSALRALHGQKTF